MISIEAGGQWLDAIIACSHDGLMQHDDDGVEQK
jgi:hypothetical protein